MKWVLTILVLSMGLAGGCAIQRTPMANIDPTYSYQQDGVVLGPDRTGSTTRVTASPEALSIGDVALD
jgi:hypothetical protein